MGLLVRTSLASGIDQNETLFSLKPRGFLASINHAHISVQQFDTHAILGQEDAIFGYVLLSSSNALDSVLWNITSGTFKNTKQTDPSGLSWSVDPCWELVYKNSKNGNAKKGSLADLITAVESGRKIRVLAGRFAFEPIVVRVRNGHVSAQGSRMALKDKETFTDVLKIKYLEVSTTGRQQELIIDYSTFTATPEADDKAETTWFAETRTWERTAQYNVTNQTYSDGSADNITAAISEGRDGRIGLDMETYEIYFDIRRLSSNLDANAFGVRTTTSGNSEFTWKSDYSWFNILVYFSGDVLKLVQSNVPINGSSYNDVELPSTYVDIFTGY